MKGYLLDTNVISELIKPVPEPKVVHWLNTVEGGFLYLSALSVGEICKGVSILSDGRKRRQLERWLNEELRAEFSGRILPIDEEVAFRWGLLSGELSRRGKPISVIDGLIASTAIVNELTIVTRNSRDFDNVSVKTLNPWVS